MQISGQIIATKPRVFTPNRGLGREFPLFQKILGWWNMIIWTEISMGWDFYIASFSMQPMGAQHPVLDFLACKTVNLNTN